MQKQTSEISKSERTRAAILEAAQALFAELGYERATVRDIAARADIDPAMVIRYFGSKEVLFARASEFDLRLPNLGEAEPSQLGATLIRHFLDLWEGPESLGRLTILLRASATNDEAAAKMRKMFAGQVMPTLSKVSSDKAEIAVRAGLISSHLMGIALCRYVLKLPPVVGMKPEQIIRNVGPTLQRYIAEPV